MFSRSPASRPTHTKPAYRPILAVLLAIGLAVSGEAALAQAPLTLHEAQQRAVARSGLVSAQAHAATAAREMAVAAGQLPDPVLKLAAENVPVEGPDRLSLNRDFMTMRRVAVMQDLPRADKRQLRSERFAREADKSLAAKAGATAAIQRDTALAWIDRHYAEAMATVAAAQVELARLEVQAAESAYRAGRGSQADIVKARAAVVEIEDRASEIGRRVTNARIMLARWVGNEETRPLGPLPATDTIGLEVEGLEARLAQHPDIALLQQQEEIARTDVRLARANRTADWSVELAYQRRGRGEPDMISVGVSVPLQWDRKRRQDRALASSLASADQAAAEREEALRGRVAEVRTMINEWQNANERHARHQRDMLPLARAGTVAADAAYRGGRATLPELLAARRNEADMHLQSLQLEAEGARLWAQLQFLFPDAGPNATVTKAPNE
ncbi:MAG TPA: TolC family protein [Telluria sp.]|nr:TolC family protein [Telluria sp.]